MIVNRSTKIIKMIKKIIYLIDYEYLMINLVLSLIFNCIKKEYFFFVQKKSKKMYINDVNFSILD